ncbi:hypothetical protein XIS1_1260006 [Xenorhabdus innexi]|uniref:Uncharacterized protein n=1 Tax=Xenorhabdus innexi TaxID=290109 RepID=A0A1N6MSD7_9GAMM|nr:hypothetical protein XIS1_1260006 [Xenorhabdus innexi]
MMVAYSASSFLSIPLRAYAICKPEHSGYGDTIYNSKIVVHLPLAMSVSVKFDICLSK